MDKKPLPYTTDDLKLLNSVSHPVWLYSCSTQDFYWANKAALQYFQRNLETLLTFKFNELPQDELNNFKVLNTLIKDEVEIGGMEQVLSGFGRTVLPGVVPHAKFSSTTYLYRPFVLLQPNNEECHCTQVQPVGTNLACPLQTINAGVKVTVKDSSSPSMGEYQRRVVSTGQAINSMMSGLIEMCDSILTSNTVDLNLVQAVQLSVLRGDIVTQPTRIEEDLISKEELDQDVGLNLLQLLGGKKLGEKFSPHNSLGHSQGNNSSSQKDVPASASAIDAADRGSGENGGSRKGAPAPHSNKDVSIRSGRNSDGNHLPYATNANANGNGNGNNTSREGSTTSSRFSWSTRYLDDGDESLLPEEHVELLPRSIASAMEAALATVDDWRFNAFELAKVTQGHPLSTLGFWLMQRYDLIRKFKLHDIKLARFLRRVEDGYPENPYHNKTHAADVLQGMHCLLTRGGLHQRLSEDLTMLAAYLAAIAHDFEHKGLNNDFLVRSSDELAVTYNDASPMENHHVASVFRLIKVKEYNFLQHLPEEKALRLRRFLIDLVLATDMKQHFNILSKFQSKLQIKLRSATANSGNNQQGHHRGQTLGEAAAADQIVMADDMDKSLILQVALKCADVGHLAAPWEVHHRWVSSLEEEFFRQGDREKTLRMGVSPLMDRCKNGISKSQVGFFDIVALPLFYSFATAFVESMPLVRAVEDNCNRWRALEQEWRSTNSK